jgi:GAF domain-containing protein
MVERLEQARREELELLAISEAISSELHLDTLLARIVAAATQLLDAERSTLFVYDRAKTSSGLELPKAPSSSRSAYRRMPGSPGRPSPAATC